MRGSAGRLISVTDGDQNVTTILRDGNGYLASLTNPAGETTEFTDTAAGLLTGVTQPANTHRLSVIRRGIMEARRYAAKLLFQFRVLTNGTANRRRVCEERIINFEAGSPQQALAVAKRKGKKEEFSYADRGKKICFEFIGILDLVELWTADSEEVWWRLMEMVTPMERRQRILPRESELSAFRTGSQRKPGRLTVP